MNQRRSLPSTWDRDGKAEPYRTVRRQSRVELACQTFLVITMIGGAWLARQNLED